MRQSCSRCARPPPVCLCQALPASPLRLHRCRVLLLQHWREDKKKKIMGTAPIVRLCLEPDSVDILVDRMDATSGALSAHETVVLFPELGKALGIRVEHATSLAKSGSEPDAGGSLPSRASPAHIHCCDEGASLEDRPLLLFPGEGALSLESVLTASERGSGSSAAGAAGPADVNDDGNDDARPRRVLIVLDGTWKQAKQLWWRHRAALAHAQRVVIMDAGSSRFEQIRRREPAHGCVSTLEALAAALAMLEGCRDDNSGSASAGSTSSSVARALLSAFDELVRLQKQFVPGPLVAEDFHKQCVSAPLRPPPPPPPMQHHAISEQQHSHY